MKNTKLSLIILFTLCTGPVNSFAEGIEGVYRGGFFEDGFPQSVKLSIRTIIPGSATANVLQFFQPRDCHLVMEYSLLTDNTHYFYLRDEDKHNKYKGWCKEFSKREGPKYIKFIVKNEKEAAYQLFHNKTLIEEHTVSKSN